MNRFKWILDIQLFAEEPEETPAASSEEPAQPKLENPLRAGKSLDEQRQAIASLEPEKPEEPTEPEVPAVEELDWAGRKVKVTDPVIKDLHKDYSHLNREYTKQQERIKDLEAQLKVPNNEPKPEKKEETPSEERLQEINEKYLEMLYENPIKANLWLNEQPEYQAMLQPLQQKTVETVVKGTQKKEQEHREQVDASRSAVEARYDDFKTLVPNMQETINKFPHIAEQIVNNPSEAVFETLYWMAKGMNVKPQEEPVTAEKLLADPEFIKKITEDEKIKNAIITNYVNGVNQKQKQTPVVIGNDGGQTPSAPEKKPQTIKEGIQMWRSRHDKSG